MVECAVKSLGERPVFYGSGVVTRGWVEGDALPLRCIPTGVTTGRTAAKSVSSRVVVLLAACISALYVLRKQKQEIKKKRKNKTRPESDYEHKEQQLRLFFRRDKKWEREGMGRGERGTDGRE